MKSDTTFIILRDTIDANPISEANTGLMGNRTTYTIRKLLLFLSLSVMLVSCETVDKVTCDRPNGVSLLQEGIMKHYIDELALKLAYDHYEEDRFIWSRFSYNFEEYLKEETTSIIAHEGGYYDYATEIISNKNFFSIRHIMTNSYDEAVNKCSCEATVNYRDSSPSTKVEYTLALDNEDYIHTEYTAPSNIVFETKGSSSNEEFIAGLLSEIRKARRNR